MGRYYGGCGGIWAECVGERFGGEGVRSGVDVGGIVDSGLLPATFWCSGRKGHIVRSLVLLLHGGPGLCYYGLQAHMAARNGKKAGRGLWAGDGGGGKGGA